MLIFKGLIVAAINTKWSF